MQCENRVLGMLDVPRHNNALFLFVTQYIVERQIISYSFFKRDLYIFVQTLTSYFIPIPGWIHLLLKDEPFLKCM